MHREPLVRPLEPHWQAVIDRVLAPLGRPSLTTSDVERLGPKLAELSQAYNAGAAEGRKTKLPIEARLAFSFPRDVPKGAAAVCELVATGALALPEGRALRVVDLGAGLGAMTWGLVRALEASGASGKVEAILVDEDPEVLRVAEAIAREAPLGRVTLSVRTRKASIANIDGADASLTADVVLVGQVLSELDVGSTAEERIARHADLLRRAGELVVKDGALVVVEPALRDRTRHLHAVRDRVLTGSTLGVFAPCLHQLACPTLREEHAWCHEDLPIDLPAWVVPLARAAGLRYQRLTFSYVVFRKDGKVLPRAGFRVVSELLPSKGKAELFGCTAEGERVRLRQITRESVEAKGVPFTDLGRGDLVTVRLADAGPDSPPAIERGRLNPKVTIDVHTVRS